MPKGLQHLGGELVELDGCRTVQLRNPNDNSGTLLQFRRTQEGGLERRTATRDGIPLDSWEPFSVAELVAPLNRALSDVLELKQA